MLTTFPQIFSKWIKTLQALKIIINLIADFTFSEYFSFLKSIHCKVWKMKLTKLLTIKRKSFAKFLDVENLSGQPTNLDNYWVIKLTDMKIFQSFRGHNLLINVTSINGFLKISTSNWNYCGNYFSCGNYPSHIVNMLIILKKKLRGNYNNL